MNVTLWWGILLPQLNCPSRLNCTWLYLFHNDFRCIPRHKCIGNHWQGQYRIPHSNKGWVNICLYLQGHFKNHNSEISSLLNVSYFLSISPNVHQALSIPYQSPSGPRWFPQDKCNRNRLPGQCWTHHSFTDSAIIRWYLILDMNVTPRSAVLSPQLNSPSTF